ncbi:Uncharacterized protein SCG7086_BH_00060 [Chlamydiales bacterium SCGC AG-110-P3]|nr:Uncharacterized protein SCG7086_BH_00060 [Chlamydiales bacterium SCGC AG-110-P3]
MMLPLISSHNQCSVAIRIILCLVITAAAFAHTEDTTIESAFTPTYRLILDPIQRTTLSAQVSSTIKLINKEMGEKIQEGETLIELDPVIVRAAYTRAHAEVERAIADLNAKQDLFSTNSVSLLQLREAEAGLATAQAELTISEAHLAACVITAPYDGKVVSLSFEVHELVQPGDELIEIVNDSTLIAKFLIPSIALDRVTIGRRIEISIQDTHSTEQATITGISSVIDPVSSTVRVEAEIDNSDGHLRSGMIGKTRLESPVEEPEGSVMSVRE